MTWLIRSLPRGQTLPSASWDARHRWMLGVLLAHVPGLAAVGLVLGRPPLVCLASTVPIVLCALAARRESFSRRWRASLVAFGLLWSSSVLTAFWSGTIEAHFHFFVALSLLGIYEEWLPYLLAFGFVGLEHGLVGALEPGLVYNHAGAARDPWPWAGVHAAFIGALGVVNVVWWRLNEDARAKTTASETRFRTAFEDANVGMAISAADGRMVRVNGAMARMFGYQREELIGRRYADLLHPDDRIRSLEADEPLTGGAVTSVDKEVRCRHREGHTLWVLVNKSTVRDESGNVVQYVAQLQDVTARRTAEAALRESEERYRSLVEHLPLAIYCCALGDPLWDVVYMSPQIEAILGYAVEDWYNDPHLFTRIVHPEDVDRVLGLNESVLRTGELQCEYRMTARDGRTVWVRQQGSVIHEDRDELRLLQGYLQDVSEERRLEEQLRIAQKLESVGQLAAGIAHEINTPIQFIGDSVTFIESGVADLLALIEAMDAASQSGLADPDAGSRYEEARDAADIPYLRERLPAAFERTSSGIQRVSQIVRAMRDFAHPGNGRHEPVSINDAIQTTLVVARSRYKLVADVETDFGDLPNVLADGGELNQAFVNLIVNAADAIADRVAGTGERGVIRVATRTDGCEVVAEISDTGTGIPPEHLERVFDPFFTTKKVGKGTGQGLAITHSIICERHGGSITVESEMGRGSVFHIRLPIAGKGAAKLLDAA